MIDAPAAPQRHAARARSRSSTSRSRRSTTSRREAEVHRAHGDHREAAALAPGDRARVRRDRAHAARGRVPDGGQADGQASSKFDGVAQSSTRVSSFMRNIDGSQWLRNPELEVVETTKGSGPGSSFTLSGDQVTVASPDDGARARQEQDPQGRAGGAGARNEHTRRTAVTRPARSRAAGRCRCAPAPWRVAFLVLSGLGIYLLVWNEQRPQPAAVRRRGAARCAGISRDKHAKAVNLEVYKQQLKDIERSFGAMLRQLPGKTEVPNLLVDISQTGLAAGLQEKLFQPQPEVQQGLLRGAADQDPPDRQLPPVRRVRQRHRGPAAHRHAARHRDHVRQQGRLRPAVARPHGQDLPLPGRGRDRRRRGREEEGRRASPQAGGRLIDMNGVTAVPTMHKSPYRNRTSPCVPDARLCRVCRAGGVLERGRRAHALHRGHQEGARRPRRAAAGDQAVRDLRLRGHRPALAVPAEQPRFGRRAGRRAPGPEAQSRVPRAVLARHA